MSFSGDITDSGFFGTEGGDGAEALDPAVIELVDGLLARTPSGREGLIRVLLGLQQVFDRVSWRVQELVADRFGLSPAQVAGVVSFYPELSAERKGRLKLDVCTGPACFLRGGDGVLRQITRRVAERAPTTGEPELAVRQERCLAVCGLGPVIRIEDRVQTAQIEGGADDLGVGLFGSGPRPEAKG